jgi:CPA2 family monovalent cation:H+ antiporter-2
MHEHQFLLEIAIALGAALAGGLLARAVRLPVIVGYLAAGIAIGPYTPGIFASREAVNPVANLGIVLLMFAVGVQFSLGELRAVGKTAVIAGLTQILGTISLGGAIGWALGWNFQEAVFLGFAISLSSTAIVMRLLEEKGEIASQHGAVTLGILVVQDLALIALVVILPALGAAKGGVGWGEVAAGVGVAVLRAALLVSCTLALALRIVPFILNLVARAHSRELFVLTVVGLSLAAAYGAEIVGLGLPLGAFLAGMVMSESDFAHDVFAQIRPLRDTFAALFFVSVGMLLDPEFLLNHWPAVLAVSAAVLFGKVLLTVLPLYLMGWHGRTVIFVAFSLGQIGEFSFVLATVGGGQGLIGPEAVGVVLSVALVTILLTPAWMSAAPRLYEAFNRHPRLTMLVNRQAPGLDPAHAPSAPPRVVIVGYGRVGRYVSDSLRAKSVPHVVVELDAHALERLRSLGVPTVYGDAASPTILDQTRFPEAELVIVSLPDASTTEAAVRHLRSGSKKTRIVARVHRGNDIPRVRAAGADAVVHAEFEAGTEMIRQGLDRLGFPDAEVDAYIEGVRQHKYRDEGGGIKAKG